MAAKLHDYISRTKKASPLGTTVFICTRLLGPILAYRILGHGLTSNWLNALGFITFVSDKGPGQASTFLSLSLSQWVIFLMACVSTIKHIYWVLFISEQELPPFSGLYLGGLESMTDSLNSWLFMHHFSFPSSSSSSSFSSSKISLAPPIPGLSLRMIIGALLFDFGITIESAAEIQRRAFKRDLRNAGKPFSGGLFGLARNINYGGHVLWKMGNAMAAGGWVWGFLVGGGHLHDFVTRGVPVLDGYCATKVCTSFLRLLSFSFSSLAVSKRKYANLLPYCPISNGPPSLTSPLYFCLFFFSR